MAPIRWAPPTLSLPSLPSSQEGRRLHQLQAVPRGPGNNNDNQATASLIRIKNEPFLEKEAIARRTELVRSVGPGALCQFRAEYRPLAPAWSLLTLPRGRVSFTLWMAFSSLEGSGGQGQTRWPLVALCSRPSTLMS